MKIKKIPCSEVQLEDVICGRPEGMSIAEPIGRVKSIHPLHTGVTFELDNGVKFVVPYRDSPVEVVDDSDPNEAQQFRIEDGTVLELSALEEVK